MKQWMKYMAVVSSVFVMAVVCFPTNGNRVSAEETVSGNEVQTDTVLFVKYNVDGAETTETIADISSGNVFLVCTQAAPSKAGYTFDGWLCSVPEVVTDSNNLNNRILKESTEYTCDGTNYNGATITLTAQWKDSYQDEVTIVYANEDGTALDGYEETITQQKKTDSEEYEISFTVTVTSNEPGKEGYTLLGWKGADGNTYTAGNTLTYRWADYSSGDSSKPRTITFTALWEQETTTDKEEDDTETGFLAKGDTPKAGENKLKAGTKYILDTGRWSVDGDATIYEGGSEFYVSKDGTYTFSQSQ